MRILRKPEVVAKTGICGMTIDRKERAGDFPRRVQLGPNSVGWVEAEVERWIAARIAARDAAAQAA